MKKTKILRVPDKRLSRPSKPVKTFGVTLKPHLKELKRVLKEAGGLGLSSIQIGDARNIFVVLSESGSVRNFINAEIISGKGSVNSKEGCLSIPGFSFNVDRFESINLKYYDVDGNQHDAEFTGRDSIVIQHELNHTEGKTLLDVAREQGR